MSWSYGSSTSNLDRVRRAVGDTDTTDQQFSDEEINAELSVTGNDIQKTAYNLLMSLAAKLSRKAVSKTAGKYSEDLKSRAAEVRKQAEMLLQQGEPHEAIAEQTFGDPSDPYSGSGEKEFLEREGLRGQY